MADQVALALTFVGSVGLFSVYVDVNETARSYQNCSVELWGMTAEFDGNKVLFLSWSRIFGESTQPSRSGPRDIRDIRSMVSKVHAIYNDTDKKLSRLLKTCTASINIELQASDTLDLEAQTAHLPVFSSRLAKLKWSLGGKRSLMMGIDAFSKQVDILYRLTQPLGSIPPTHPRLQLQDQAIWLTVWGVSRQLHLGLCKPVQVSMLVVIIQARLEADLQCRALFSALC